MLQGLKYKLLISVALGAVVFIGLSVYSDLDRLQLALGRFSWSYLPLVLALSLGNFLVRFVRWHFYLRLLDVRIRMADNLVVFFSGLVMSITPGKAGELLKSYLIRTRYNIPVSQSDPAILAERLADIISLIFLAFLGIFSFRKGAMFLVLGGGGMALMLGVLAWPSGMRFCIGLLERVPVVCRLVDPLGRAYEGVRVLISLRNLSWAVVLGAGAWFAECLGFYVILQGIQAPVGVLNSAFIYSLSTLFGAVTMLPGGLGPTEGSLSGLLLLNGVLRENAVAATLLIRLCTLWFAVVLGAGAMVVFGGRFRGAIESEVEPEAPKSVQGV